MFKIIILSAVSVLISAYDDVSKTDDFFPYKDFQSQNPGLNNFNDLFGGLFGESVRKSNFDYDYGDVSNDTVIYDAFFGKPLTTKRENYLANVANSSILCTVPVRPCRKYEDRRVDGSCTNPKHPSRGARLSPLPRLLPAKFGPGNSLRPAKDGSELPSARLLRTTLLGDGYFRDHDFSILATHIFVFSFVDNVDLFYLLRYAVASDCCVGEEPNPAGPFCIPVRVPADDPYLRRAGVRCQNLTRVETYQDYGCLPPTLPAERYNRVTPLLDLSVVYGNTEERNREIRLYQKGLLAFRMEGDREVPAGDAAICIGNRPPETSCYNFGDPYQGNLLSGIYLTAMWFFREHNRLARELALINPCWEDEQLFRAARRINIAQWQQIYYYELLAEFLGRKNAVAEGVISDSYGHVNDFDPRYEPGVYREYVIANRWFHTFQPALVDTYRNGKYVGSRTAVDDAFRSGILGVNNTEADVTQGAYIQPADKLDMVIDPDLAERVHGESQRSADLPAIDMMRGRDAGLPPYNDYRQFCGLKRANKFEDFYDTIDKDKVEMLRRLYDDVDDVELMVAIYVEKLLPGAYVGASLYCIIVHNLLLWRRSDKYFFEHGDIPTALTLDQLYEVRQASMARVLCDSGDGVTQIQPRALLRKRPWNDIVSCNDIPGMDLYKWQDHKCAATKTKK